MLRAGGAPAHLVVHRSHRFSRWACTVRTLASWEDPTAQPRESSALGAPSARSNPAPPLGNSTKGADLSVLDETIGDTLALVNMVREAFGHQALGDLPDARPGDSQDCLYFRALKDIGASDVGTGTIKFNSARQAATVAALWGTHADGHTVHSPKSVRHVISQFDRRQTPRYNV